MHFDVPLGWIVLSGEGTPVCTARNSEVPTTSEPCSCIVWVVAAVTDCDRTKEATVDDLPSFFFPSPVGMSVVP